MIMRIYVADLGAYNAGFLHGTWIDASEDLHAMQEAINAMLAESPEPNVTRAKYHCAHCERTYYATQGFSSPLPDSYECDECGADLPMQGQPFPSAEEWAIHDHEGLGDLGEYAGLHEVARRVQVAELADDRGIPVAVLLEFASERMAGNWDSDDLESEIDDSYRGAWESWADMIEELEEETGGLAEVPERFQYYIDFEKMGRDAEISGDFTAYRDGQSGDLYFFWAH